MIQKNKLLNLLIVVVLYLILFASFAFAGPRLYFSSNDITVGIFSMDLNGQNITTLYDPAGSGADPGRIAIDDIDSMLYFTVPSQNKIMRLNIDGGPVVVEDFATLPVAPTFISIDVPGRAVFWTNENFQTRRQGIYTNIVEEMDYTGNAEIVVAPLHNKIFTNDSGYSEIFSYPLDPFDLFGIPTSFRMGPNKAMSILHNSGKIVHGFNGQVVTIDISSPSDDPVPLFSFPDVTLWATASNYDESYVYYALSPYIGKSLIGSNQETLLLDNAPYSYIGLAMDCGRFAPDTDGDGTPNCDDSCPVDPLKTLPLSCGCGVSDTDSDGDGMLDCADQCPMDSSKTTPGLCGCGVSDTLFTNPVSCQPFVPTAIPTATPQVDPDPVPEEIILEKGTKITVPPTVTVVNRTVQIFLIKFTKVVFKPKKNKKDKVIMEAKAGKVTYRYKVNVKNTSAKKKTVYTLNSKRNVLTLKNLAPGNYSVNYRAEIIKDGKVASKTNLSPTSTFAIQ